MSRHAYNPPISTRRPDAFGRLKSKVGVGPDDWEYTDVVAVAVQQGRALRPCETVTHLDGDILNTAVDTLELNQLGCYPDTIELNEEKF